MRSKFVDRVDSNRRAPLTWEVRAVGSQRSVSPPGSRAYFEDIRRYRYGYETPFIPGFFGFADLAGRRVLEIGVGNGIDAVEMLRGGAIYTGIDITRNHLDLARRYMALVRTEVPGRVEAIVEGDLTETQLPGDYDVVYSFGVLHHIEHESDYLRRIHDLLRPGGILCIGVYSRVSFFNAWLAATWVLRDRMRHTLVDWQSHVAERSDLGRPVVVKIRRRAEVEGLLVSHGFEVVRYAKQGFVLTGVR